MKQFTQVSRNRSGRTDWRQKFVGRSDGERRTKARMKSHKKWSRGGSQVEECIKAKERECIKARKRESIKVREYQSWSECHEKRSQRPKARVTGNLFSFESNHDKDNQHFNSLCR